MPEILIGVSLPAGPVAQADSHKMPRAAQIGLDIRLTGMRRIRFKKCRRRGSIAGVIFKLQILLHIVVEIDQQLLVDLEKAHDRPVEVGDEQNHR